MTYLLDSNAWIYSFRRPRSVLASRLSAAYIAGGIVLCEIVKAELLQGALLANNPRRDLQRLRSLFTLYPSHPFDGPVAEQWARVNAPLRRVGTPIGPFDAAIAATALVHRCTVVTHNRKHFDLVPGLAVEDWEAEEAG